MNITKEAHTLYALMNLLKISSNYIDYLNGSPDVPKPLKQDLTAVKKKVKILSDKCSRSLRGDDRKKWQREFTERDYEVYGNILFLLNDMSEEQRSVAEQFMEELSKGNVKMEAA